MSRWQLEFSRNAEKDLAALDRSLCRRIIDKLEWLVVNFDYITPLPLSESWRGFFKLRIGDWRAVYEIKHSQFIILVHYIDRRDKIYKRKLEKRGLL